MGPNMLLTGSECLGLTALPPCPGPKLSAFPKSNSRINWISRLGYDPELEAIETRSFVFRARIGAQEYAIKVFKHYEVLEVYNRFKPVLPSECTMQRLQYQIAPFFAECRAYGRIKDFETQDASRIGSKYSSGELEDPLRQEYAASCHGFLTLGVEDVKALKSIGTSFGLDLLSETRMKKALKQMPIFAIVKTLESFEGNIRCPRKALKGIQLLNRLKIYNRDIQTRNFKGWRLIDFDSSWTEPNCMMEAMSRTPVKRKRAQLVDLIMFDAMVTKENIRTAIRALPDAQQVKRLRRDKNLRSVYRTTRD